MGERSILIIDDDRATSNVLAVAFQGEGYECRLAHSFREAMAGLSRPTLPDLIILDLLLPDGNGVDLLDHLAAEPARSRIPVIIMSAWGKAPDVARARRLELLSKPFSLSEAEALVRRLIVDP